MIFFYHVHYVRCKEHKRNSLSQEEQGVNNNKWIGGKTTTKITKKIENSKELRNDSNQQINITNELVNVEQGEPMDDDPLRYFPMNHPLKGLK